MKDIGKNIKSIRQSKAMTQEALAEALFVTRQTVSNYENGRSRPDLDMLLKIAQILETDVNTIIYGPPVPQSKKEGYKWLAISAGLFILLTGSYIVLEMLFSKRGLIGYEYSLRLMIRMALLPAVLFLLGWTLTHCLHIFGKLQQLSSRKVKVLRAIVLVLAGLVAVIPIPLIIFNGVAGYRSFVYHEVHMTFPYIPVYQEILLVMVRVIFKAPGFYTVLGSLCWILGLPRINKPVSGDTTE